MIAPPPKAIVLGGGGLSCIAFTGALRRIEEHHPDFMQHVELFVGCSAGSLLAFLFVMGMTPQMARDWCYARILALSANELDLEGAFELTTHLGIDDGSRMETLLIEALAMWGLTAETTFRDLATTLKTNREFVVCVTNVTRGRREFMCARTSPTVPLALAMRMSMTVPMLYRPVHFRKAVYVDGGIVDNCPVDVWFARQRRRASSQSSKSSQSSLSPVLVLDLVDTVSTCNDAVTMPTLWGYIRDLFNTTIGNASHRARRCRARAASHGDMTYIAIPPLTLYPFFSTRSLSFEMNAASVDALDRAGYEAIVQHEAMTTEPMSMTPPIAS